LSTVSLLQLVEQPHVLDRDHRLTGEGLQQGDLILRQPEARLRMRDDDRSYARAGAHQRHERRGAEAPRFRRPAREVRRLGRGSVDELDNPFFDDGAGRDGALGVERQRIDLAHSLEYVRRRPFPDVGRVQVELSTLEHRNRRRAGGGKTPGAPDDRVEHGLHVRRRFADDLEDLGGRRLPLERLPGLVEEAHVLDRDRGLVGEGLQQVDLRLRRLAGLAPSDDHRAERPPLSHDRHAQHAPPVTGHDGVRIVVRVGRRVGDLHH
jgi:hypothetical protein